MNTEEKNNLVDTNNDAPKKRKFKEKLVAFFKNNKAATVLTVLLLVVIVWFSIKIRVKDKNYNTEKTELITNYEEKIDSLQIKHIEFATEVFSWSVRSELLRENTENLNQLLTVFVKHSGADLVQIVNSEDKMVLLSSDKKSEGSLYTEDLDFELKESTVIKKDSSARIITPVMGFNSMIGILIVELN